MRAEYQRPITDGLHPPNAPASAANMKANVSHLTAFLSYFCSTPVKQRRWACPLFVWPEGERWFTLTFALANAI